MFSASVSIDTINGVKHNSVTIYHQAWVIRLLNDRLTKEAPVLDYSTLGSVIPLLYYNVRYFRALLSVSSHPENSADFKCTDDRLGSIFSHCSSERLDQDATIHAGDNKECIRIPVGQYKTVRIMTSGETCTG